MIHHVTLRSLFPVIINTSPAGAWIFYKVLITENSSRVGRVSLMVL
ncbi:hypothetical protein HanPI659440_Chr08g0309031 [Helianthus annuus]|nr:hypothetical protein HanPI659440_Chr08g0309031 [Helianthus annuus]